MTSERWDELARRADRGEHGIGPLRSVRRVIDPGDSHSRLRVELSCGHSIWSWSNQADRCWRCFMEAHEDRCRR
jgi:hypothetical protein